MLLCFLTFVLFIFYETCRVRAYFTFCTTKLTQSHEIHKLSGEIFFFFFDFVEKTSYFSKKTSNFLANSALWFNFAVEK